MPDEQPKARSSAPTAAVTQARPTRTVTVEAASSAAPTHGPSNARSDASLAVGPQGCIHLPQSESTVTT